MKKSLIIAITLCSTATYAITPITYTPGKPITVGVSSDEPNFISFKDDRVEQLSVQAGMLDHSVDPDTGELMLIPTEAGAQQQKISALITTENGVRLRIGLHPIKGVGAELVLSPTSPLGQSVDIPTTPRSETAPPPSIMWGKEFNSEKEAALNLAQEMVRYTPNSHIPDGINIKDMNNTVKTALPDGFEVHLTQLWITTALVGEKLEIVNKSASALPLHERQLNASSGVGVYVDAPMYLIDKDAFNVQPKHHIAVYRIRRN